MAHCKGVFIDSLAARKELAIIPAVNAKTVRVSIPGIPKTKTLKRLIFRDAKRKFEIAKGTIGLIRTKNTREPSFCLRDSISAWNFGFFLKSCSVSSILKSLPRPNPKAEAREYPKIKKGNEIQPKKNPDANAIKVVGSKAKPISKAPRNV